MATTAVRSCFRAGLNRSGSRGHRPGMATMQVRRQQPVRFCLRQSGRPTATSGTLLLGEPDRALQRPSGRAGRSLWAETVPRGRSD